MKVNVAYDGLSLTMSGQALRHRESIKIMNGYPQTFLSRVFFSQLGLMHLVAPHMPRQISTDFIIVPEFEKIIGEMYDAENLKPPIIKTPKKVPVQFSMARPKAKKAVVAYSAGKDSLWNMLWMQEEYGKENVLAVHIKNLNKASGRGEFLYTQKQASTLGFENTRIIELRNGSSHTGRNLKIPFYWIFLSGIIIPQALEFGASQIVTEKLRIVEPMISFNKMLKRLGIPIEIIWRERTGIDKINDLLNYAPRWLPYVHNCFTPACYKNSTRRSWFRRTPSLPLYDSQCGSCFKCRLTTMIRLLSDPNMAVVSREDATVYLSNTAKWICENRVKNSDIIPGSFLEAFKMSSDKYGLNFTLPTIA